MTRLPPGHTGHLQQSQKPNPIVPSPPPIPYPHGPLLPPQPLANSAPHHLTLLAPTPPGWASPGGSWRWPGSASRCRSRGCVSRSKAVSWGLRAHPRAPTTNMAKQAPGARASAATNALGRACAQQVPAAPSQADRETFPEGFPTDTWPKTHYLAAQG